MIFVWTLFCACDAIAGADLGRREVGVKRGPAEEGSPPKAPRLGTSTAAPEVGLAGTRRDGPNHRSRKMEVGIAKMGVRRIIEYRVLERPKEVALMWRRPT